MKALKSVLVSALYLFMAYAGIAFTVFQWRNPTANRLSFYRDFSAVIRFEKLAKYQTP